ncbi:MULTISPECIES: HAD family hydrolase [unclassified Streptomyces]|uniref:HAD family hydrolase n=1 Tax=Streptomyces sp. NPDC005955 TaxID=3364738 RepID=UPI0036BB25B1
METILLDVDETLLRRGRYWDGWADWLQVPRHTVSALVGAVVAQGRAADDALRVINPDMDVESAARAREAAGRGEYLDERDLYPDVRPALGALRERGVRIIVAGTASVRCAELLRGLDLPVNLVADTAEWGVAKPKGEFFERALALAGTPGASTLYVGDHPGDDVFPAKAAGLRVAHLRRGPWGHLWSDDPDVIAAADWQIDSLMQLGALVGD